MNFVEDFSIVAVNIKVNIDWGIGIMTIYLMAIFRKIYWEDNFIKLASTL